MEAASERAPENGRGGPGRQPVSPGLLALRERKQRIRSRVATIAVGIFGLAWVGLFVQLVLGNDPSVGNGGAGAPASAGQSLADVGIPLISFGSEESDDSDDLEAAPAPTPLTTSQS